MTTLAEIEAAALALPDETRVALGRRLIEPVTPAAPLPSFPGESGRLLRRLLERRWAAHLADPSAAVDAEVVLAELEAEDEATDAVEA